MFVYSQCPSNSLIEPCSCTESNSSNIQIIFHSTLTKPIPIRQNSIVCEHIQNSSFDLRSVFIKLSTTNNHHTHFNDFLLHDTQINHLPKHLFGNITFSSIILNNNPLLTSIDIDTFDNTRNYIEVFKIFNTSLSDSNTLFTIIKQFNNLRFFSMENDKLQSIPDYAFNHTHLEYIWLGVPCTKTIQPINHIGKCSFAVSRRTISSPNDINQMLHIYIGGSMINASSFELTSLTRFRNRQVLLRIYNTSIDYLDEQIFQPFLAAHSSSLLDIQDSNISRICDYRSLWIKEEFCTNTNCNENRVYGTACFSL